MEKVALVTELFTIYTKQQSECKQIQNLLRIKRTSKLSRLFSSLKRIKHCLPPLESNGKCAINRKGWFINSKSQPKFGNFKNEKHKFNFLKKTKFFNLFLNAKNE